MMEVVVALVVLELAFVGVAAMLELASTTLALAETVELAVARAEGVLDSLNQADFVGPGVRDFGGGVVEWSVTEDGEVLVSAVTVDRDTLFVIHALLTSR